jgi:hypothetical protein
MKKFSLVVGCGYTSQRGLCKSKEIVATDFDKAKIKKAKRQDQKADYVVCDALFLPFRSDFFNDIICTEVLEHIMAYEKVIHGIAELKARFIYLRFPTETREKLLIKASKVYREQVWGKIHVRIVKPTKVINILEKYGYEVHRDLSDASSTLVRLFLHSFLEVIKCDYEIPEIGSVSFSQERRLYKFIIYILPKVFGRLGHITYWIYKLFGLETLHDSYLIFAKYHENATSIQKSNK